MALIVSLARSPEDVEAVRQLCRDFVSWQLDEFPELRTKILTYFEPAKWEEILAALPQTHARPRGAMLLAREEGRPVGCIMVQPADGDTAEVKRLFVSADARGGGVGGALVEAVLEQARTDGYSAMVLDTARFLDAAQRLYHRFGFVDIAPPEGLPPEIGEVAVFMRREL